MANPYAGSSKKYTQKDQAFRQTLQGLAPSGLRAAAKNAVAPALGPLRDSTGHLQNQVGGVLGRPQTAVTTNPAGALPQGTGPGGLALGDVARARQAGASMPSAGAAQMMPQGSGLSSVADAIGTSAAGAFQGLTSGLGAAMNSLTPPPPMPASPSSGALFGPSASGMQQLPTRGDGSTMETLTRIAGMQQESNPFAGMEGGGVAPARPIGPKVPVMNLAINRADGRPLMESMDGTRSLGEARPMEDMLLNAGSPEQRFNANRMATPEYQANQAQQRGIESLLGSARNSIAASAEGNPYPTGGGQTRQDLLRATMTPGGMASLPGDTGGTGPIPVPRGRMRSDLEPMDGTITRDNPTGITRSYTPDGQLVVRGPNRDGNETILPRSGNSLGRRYMDYYSGQPVTVSDHKAMRDRLTAAAAEGDTEAQRRLDLQDGYRERRDARQQDARELRTAAANYQNYGQQGSMPVGMAAGAMGSVNPLYASVFGPNMGRGQAISNARADQQDPTGEQRSLRGAMGMAARNDPGALLRFGAARDANALAKQQLDIDRMRAASEDRWNQAQIDTVGKAGELSQQDIFNALASNPQRTPQEQRTLDSLMASAMGQGEGEQVATNQPPAAANIPEPVINPETGQVENAMDLLNAQYNLGGQRDDGLLQSLKESGLSDDQIAQLYDENSGLGSYLAGNQEIGFSLPWNLGSEARRVGRERAPIESLGKGLNAPKPFWNRSFREMLTGG